jgi:hypothetical protein
MTFVTALFHRQRMQDVIIPVVLGCATDSVYDVNSTIAATDVPAIFESQKAVLSQKQKVERKEVKTARQRPRRTVTTTVALPVVAAVEVSHVIP